MFKNCFDSDLNIEYFKWKFLNNPAGEFLGFIAVTELGEVASYYGVIPERYIIHGQSKLIYQSCDTMTHSSHRRRGLFQKLALHCYKYLQEKNELFLIGFSGEKSTPGFLKMGWKNLFLIVNYFYPAIFTIFSSYQQDADVHEILNYREIEYLIIKSNKNSIIHSEKTIDSFTWRLANPNHSYRVLAINVNGLYNSYLVYYIERDKIILFDFYFESKNHAKKLMNKLKIILKERKLKGVVSFCQENSSFADWLRHLGFFYNPFSWGFLSDKACFILYSDSNLINKYKNPDNWSINSYDHDAL